jgi:Zn-dependent peptidase ImmA (M78 family)
VSDQMENEANHFAMCLLMPESVVRKEAKKIGYIDLCATEDENLKKLACKFHVSMALMAMRLQQIYKL